MTTIPPGAHAKDVLYDMGRPGTAPPPPPRAPAIERISSLDPAEDALTRARVACRLILLAAPLSMPAAADALDAVAAGNYAPAYAIAKHPVAYWAAAAVVIRRPAPPPWRVLDATVTMRATHAATAAGAAALDAFAANAPAWPGPDAFWPDLDALYAAALACEPPEFVCRALVARAAAGRPERAFRRIAGAFIYLYNHGSPPPRDQFAAYAGMYVALLAQRADAECPAPEAGPAPAWDTAAGRVLALCHPVARALPPDLHALYESVFNEAGRACDHAALEGAWCAPPLMDGYPFSDADPLDLAMLPVPLPPPADVDLDIPIVGADGRPNMCAVYNYAAHLTHSGDVPMYGPQLGQALVAHFAASDLATAQWVRLPASTPEDRRKVLVDMRGRPVIVHPSGLWVPRAQCECPSPASGDS